MEAIIRRTRRAAVQALASAVTTALSQAPAPSEADLRDAWLSELRAQPALLPDGWYSPPPGGLAVLIGEPPAYDRLGLPSLRAQDAWPRSERRWSTESVVYAYASPVDRATGLIGDLAVVLYAGASERISEHLRECRRLAEAIAEQAEVGMAFADLYAWARTELQARGYANDIASSTDPAGTNVGHTVPLTEVGRTPREAFPDCSDAELRSALGRARLFLSPDETARIMPGTVLTIEPRISAAGLPTVGFHLMVAFDEQGNRTLIDELGAAEDAYRRAVLG